MLVNLASLLDAKLLAFYVELISKIVYYNVLNGMDVFEENSKLQLVTSRIHSSNYLHHFNWGDNGYLKNLHPKQLANTISENELNKL